MNGDLSDSQRRIQRAAIEQERECGVLADENSPRLPPEARNRIYNVRLGRVAKFLLEISYPHILSRLDRTTFLAPDRPEKMTATFELELQGYAAYEFDLLAKEYVEIAQNSTELDQWLKNLTELVENEVFCRWRPKWNFHVSPEVQRKMVRTSLEECVARWSTQGPATQRSETDKTASSPTGHVAETGTQDHYDQGRCKWAVCPSASGREKPLLFHSEEEARKWRLSTLSHQADFLVPVTYLLDYRPRLPCSTTMQDFLHKERKRPIVPLTLHEKIDQFFAGQALELKCSLGKDWAFHQIQVGPATQARFKTGIYSDSRESAVVEFLGELGNNLSQSHPGLTAAAVADFWQSWEVQRHLADFCIDLETTTVSGQPASLNDWAEAEIAAYVEKVFRAPLTSHSENTDPAETKQALNEFIHQEKATEPLKPALAEAHLVQMNADIPVSSSATSLRNAEGVIPALEFSSLQADVVETRDPGQADLVADERRNVLAVYKTRGRALHIRITDAMVARAANPGNWNDRTMVTWWKRNDFRCKQPHDRKIRAVLAENPASLWPSIKRKIRPK